MSSDAEPGIPIAAAGSGAPTVRAMLERSPLGAIQLPRPMQGDLPYRDFIEAVLRAPGFRLDFNRLTPDAALAMLSDQLFGKGAFVGERALLAEELAMLAELVGGITGARAAVSVRTYFAPGDLVWHVDRLSGSSAYRLVWPIGRPAGMRVTPIEKVDRALHDAFMRREYPLLGRLDAQVLRTGAAPEALWAHRPAQLAALASGTFPFLRDPGLEFEVAGGAASIHRVETPRCAGTYHRSSWANRHSPGFQIVVTAADAA